VGKYVPLNSVCSRMPSTPPSAWMTFRAVVVEVPQLAVVPLVGPKEGVVPADLELLELRTHAPPFVVRQRVAVPGAQRGRGRGGRGGREG
jgi:hypothetical protein